MDNFGVIFSRQSNCFWLIRELLNATQYKVYQSKAFHMKAQFIYADRRAVAYRFCAISDQSESFHNSAHYVS
jgi:hypothetical protein